MRLAAALLLAAFAARAEEPVAVHVVDPARRFQTIDHFGASDCWTIRILGQWSRRDRERVNVRPARRHGPRPRRSGRGTAESGRETGV